MNWNNPNNLLDSHFFHENTVTDVEDRIINHWPSVKGRRDTIPNKGQFNTNFGDARDPDEGDQTLPLIDGNLE